MDTQFRQDISTQYHEAVATNDSALQLEIQRLEEELATLKRQLWVPAGHYYSALPDLHDIEQRSHQIWGPLPSQIAGIDLRGEAQLALMHLLEPYYRERLHYTHEQQADVRYYYNNPFFGYGDSMLLYCMMRHLKPHRIIEVGSGFSSAVILDTSEFFFEDDIDCTFIEPHPERLYSLMKPTDSAKNTIIATNLQDIDISLIQQLQADDILFVDSTHVAKVGSDVNYLFSCIYPALNNGVYIHIHDIFYPFEYPQEWVFEGRTWSEGYLLRAFLQYNNAFEIIAFNDYLRATQYTAVSAIMPLWGKNTGGSIWLKKL